MTTLRSPATGAALHADTPHSLAGDAADDRWPVLDSVPFLRVGRDELRAAALERLDADDAAGAAALLLADNDDWWDEAPPPADQLRRAHAATTLRDAVDALGLGRVGDYFLHRDHDPSGLAVAALTAAHPPAGRPVLDLACGAGHLLRRLAQHGERDLVGVDVVFAKVWLARRFVLPPAAGATLVCADLAARWPLAPHPGTYVTCHDALYFLDDPAAVLATAAEHAGAGGAVLAAHCHNAESPAGQGGHPRRPEAWAALLPGARSYGEEELTSAALERRVPRPADADELLDTEAVALVRDGGAAAAELTLLDPPEPDRLRVNPLYVDRRRSWPNERWGAEYGPRAATYLPETLPGPVPGAADAEHEHWVRTRLLVDLPERW